MMYEKYMLCKDSLANWEEDGEALGYSLQIRIPYYRGVPLSFLEDILVEVDGEKFTGDDLTFTVSGGTFTLQEMPTITFFRWEFGEKATLHIRKPGGLKPGTHNVVVGVLLRISYLPFMGYVNAWADMELA